MFLEHIIVSWKGVMSVLKIKLSHAFLTMFWWDMLDLITLLNVHVRIWASILHQVVHMKIRALEWAQNCQFNLISAPLQQQDSQKIWLTAGSGQHRNAFWDYFSAVFLIETNQGILEDRIMLLPTLSSSFCVIRSPTMPKIVV